MKLNELFTDERAVSPVVGVALLIAMTVILAAVIGSVVLGLGSGANNAPQASFSFEQANTSAVNVTHDGGDTLGEDVTIKASGGDETSITSEWTAGGVRTVNATDGETVRVIWEDPENDKTQVLATYEV